MNFRRQISLAAMRAATEHVHGGAVAAWHKFADELNRAGEDEQPDPRERRGLAHGLYVIRWREGGASLASVGYDAAGRNWYSPANWTSGPCFDWSKVESEEPVLLEKDWRDKEEE